MPTFPHQANNYSNLHKESDKLSLLSILKKYSGDNIYLGIQEIARMRAHTGREAGIDLRDRLADRLIKCSETLTSHDNIKPVSYLYDLQQQLRQHPDTKQYSEEHLRILKKQIEHKSLMVALFETELPEDLSMMIKKANQKDCNILDDVITDKKQHRRQPYDLGVHSFLQSQGIAILNIQKIESAYELTLPGLLVSLDNMNTINHWSSWYRNDLENWFTFIREKYVTKQSDNNIQSGLSAFIQSFKRKDLLSALKSIPAWNQFQAHGSGTFNNQSYYDQAKKGKLGVVVQSYIDRLAFARSFYFVAQYTQSQMFEKWPLNDRLSFLTLFFQTLDAEAFQNCWLGCAERLIGLCVRIVRDHARFLFDYNTIDWHDDSRISPFINKEKEASPLLHALFMRALFNIQTQRDNSVASRYLLQVLQALKRLADQSNDLSINQLLKRIYAKLFENRSSTKILQKIHPDFFITESDHEKLEAFSQQDQETIDAIAQRLFTNKTDLNAPASYDEKFHPIKEIINKKVRQIKLADLLESDFKASPNWIYCSEFEVLKKKIAYLQSAQELQNFLSDLLTQLRSCQSSLPSFTTYFKQVMHIQNTIRSQAALDDNSLLKDHLPALEQLCRALSCPMIDRSWRADLEKLFKGQAIDTHCALVPRMQSKRNSYLKQIDLEYYEKAFLPQFDTAPSIELFLEHASALSGLTEKHLCTILSIIGSTAPVAHLEHLGDCYLKSAVSRGYYYLFEQHRAYAQQPHKHSYFLNDTKLSDALISVHHDLIKAYKESDQNDDFKNYLSPSSTTRAYDYFPLEVEQYNPRKYATLLESNQPHLVESLFIRWAQNKNVSHNKQIKDIIHQTIDWMHAHSLYTLTEAVMFLAQSFDLTEEIINDLFVRMCLSQNQLPQLNAFINEWHSKKPQLSLFGQIQSQLRYDVDYCDIILNNPYYLDRILKSNPSRLLGCHQQQELQLKTIETLYLKNHEKYQNDPVQWLEFYNTYIAQSAHKKELSLLFLDYLHKKNIQSAQHFFDLIVSPQKEEYADLWVELFFKKILESYFFLKPGQNQSLQFVSFLEQKIAESGRLPHDFFGHKVNDWDLTSHHNEELYYKIQIKDDLLFIIRLAKLMGLNHIIFNPVALLTIDSSAKYFFNKTHDNIKLSIGNERRLAADTVKQQAAQQNHLQNPQESSAPRPFYIRAIVFLYTVFARIINLWCYTISAIKNFFFRHTHPHLFTRAAPIRLFGLNQPQNREQTAAQQRPSPRVNVVDGHHQSAERAYSLRKI